MAVIHQLGPGNISLLSICQKQAGVVVGPVERNTPVVFFFFFIDHLTHRERSCLSGLKEQQGNVWTAHRSMITLDPRQSGQ